MKRRGSVLAWAAIAVALCLHAGLWNRALGADNRLYFYMAERAASGVAPHVSAPDVKNQLATLVSGASIVVGRAIGLDDVRAGRLASLATLVAGVSAVGLVVFELGGSTAAAAVAAVSTLAFGSLVDHSAIGFNPKVLLFALIAWTHLLLARGRFGLAGVSAAGALLCWQPAGAVCVAASAAALVQAPRWRRISHLALGGIAAVALYEAYFAWHGALMPQLFQAYLLPLGSVHGTVDVADGLSFVAFCEQRGLDRFGLPAAAFALFLVDRLWWLLRRADSASAAQASTAPAALPAVVALIVGGLACIAFTIYDHQAEPDRFLLSAYFATAFGVVVDRALRLLGSLGGQLFVARLEAVLVVLILVVSTHTSRDVDGSVPALERQFESARIVRMYADAYGTVWAFGCAHLLGLAHMTNYHPLAYIWDDLELYLDAARFEPKVGGRLPDVILAARSFPGQTRLTREYAAVPVPALSQERVRLYVRKEARVESKDAAAAGQSGRGPLRQQGPQRPRSGPSRRP